MKFFTILIFSFLSGFPNDTSHEYSGVVQECNNVEAKVEIKVGASGKEDSVEVTLTKGNRKDVKYIFCGEKGKVLNESNFDKNSISGLKPGDYMCLVRTLECTKKLYFTIK